MVILKSWVILDHPGVILGHPWIILCHLGVILGRPGSSQIFPVFYWLALSFLSFYHFISSRLSWDLTIVSVTDVRILNENLNKKKTFPILTIILHDLITERQCNVGWVLQFSSKSLLHGKLCWMCWMFPNCGSEHHHRITQGRVCAVIQSFKTNNNGEE